MRPVLRSDIEHCVRVVQAVGLDAGADTMRGLLARADIADRYRKQTGRVHLLFGDGSLGSIARKQDRAEVSAVCDSQFCLALGLVVQQILEWTIDRGERVAKGG